MQPIDFSRLLDSKSVASGLPPDMGLEEDIYQGRDGVQFRSQDRNKEYTSEVVRLSDWAFLFASDCSHGDERLQHQIVNDSDWVHIQFRLCGGGSETVSQADVIETPEKSCIVARYPKDSMIERRIDKTNSWKVACLFVSPKGLTDFLDVPVSGLPQNVQWMAEDSSLELQSTTLPLQSTMVLAVNDILACSFRGGIRRAYMRAKSLELLSTVIDSLDNVPVRPRRSGVKLSAADLDKLSLSRTLMTEDLESNLTLAQLARRVGLNRTKLALGFKEVYGASVQAYWRDAKLSRARELLRDGDARITEVAFSLGYSELSSFTRAFSRKFGVLPRDCKPTGA